MATTYEQLAYRTPEGQNGQQVYNPTTGKAYSSPEQLATDLGIQSTQIDWSKVGAGMNADNLGNGGLQIPTAPKYDATTATNFWQSTAAGLQSQMEQYQKGLETTNKGLMENQTPMTDILNQQYEKWGVAGMFDQIKTWSEEANAVRENIATLQDQENQALLDVEGQRVSLATMTGRQSIISRRYDSKIAAEGARLSGYGAMIESTRGNLSMAQSFANEFVQAATYDYQVKRDTLQQFYNYNKDMFSYLGSEYSSAVKNMVDSADKEYQKQYDEKQQVAQLMLQYPTAGINAQDTLATATAKAQAPAAQEWNLKIADLQKGISGGVDTSSAMFTSTMQAEIDAGSTPEEAALVAAATAEQLGIQLSKEERASLIKIAKTLIKTPVVPETITPKKTAVQTGQYAGSIIKELPSSLLETVTKPFKAVGGFFKGLFGG